MTVYLLVQEQPVCVQGYEVATEQEIIGVYSTRQKAFRAMWDQTELDNDPMVDYRIIEREVM